MVARLGCLASLVFAVSDATLPLKGMSEAGAEFGQSIPGVMDKDYTFPLASSIQHLTGLGFGAIRVPFLWERLQPSLRGDFQDAYFSNLKQTVSTITSSGAVAVLDPHNYARYNGKVIGDGVAVDDFVDFWKRLATYYKNDPNVAFAIMNEPNSMSTDSWASTAQSAINGIRSTGANQLVLVPGNAWTGAHSWFETWYGTANAVAFKGFTDPGNNFAFELHQYLDGDASGTSSNCDGTSKGTDALAPVTSWLKENGYRGFLGEFGAGNNNVCQQAVEAMLSHMDDNSDIWIGWTWWAAGPWWKDYFTSVEPNADGSDKPQTAWLRKHLPGPSPTPVPPMPAPSPEPSPTPAPTPSDCPGGSLDACIDLCPADVFAECVKSCQRRCEGSLFV